MEHRECGFCGKEISDHEFVVHWGSCSDCFDENFDRYLRIKETEDETRDK